LVQRQGRRATGANHRFVRNFPTARRRQPGSVDRAGRCESLCLKETWTQQDHTRILRRNARL